MTRPSRTCTWADEAEEAGSSHHRLVTRAAGVPVFSQRQYRVWNVEFCPELCKPQGQRWERQDGGQTGPATAAEAATSAASESWGHHSGQVGRVHTPF